MNRQIHMNRGINWCGVIGATVCFTGILMLVFPEPRNSPLPRSTHPTQTKRNGRSSEPVPVPDRTRKIQAVRR